MHELAISFGLLTEASRVAQAHGATRVTRLLVQIGPLSGVEAAQLARAFGVARVGTLAENAELEIEAAPVVVFCAACGTQSTVAANALLCDDCGTWKVTLRSGNELLLKRVDLAGTMAPPADAASALRADGDRHV